MTVTDHDKTADHRLRAMHYARVDLCVALSREGILDEYGTEGLAAALEVAGIRPPIRVIDALRRRFPNLYGLVEATPDTQDERDLLRRLHAAALNDYAADLLDAYDLVADLEANPLGTYERDHDLEGLAVPMGMAAADYLETSRDELDDLIGESYPPTHQPG